MIAILGGTRLLHVKCIIAGLFAIVLFFAGFEMCISGFQYNHIHPSFVNSLERISFGAVFVIGSIMIICSGVMLCAAGAYWVLDQAINGAEQFAERDENFDRMDKIDRNIV